MESIVNGLCDVKCSCANRGTFTKYYGWRDPDLANKPRIWSIPNRMKRFMADLKGELIVKNKHRPANSSTHKEPVPTTRSAALGSSSTIISTYQPPEVPLLVDVHGHKNAEDDNQRWARLHKSLQPMFGSTVIRCAACDYPYDNSKRRKPPHPYDPVVVPVPQRLTESWRWRGDKPPSDESLAGLKDIPSAKTNKVHRMKRRRSSTELYKGFVSVD